MKGMVEVSVDALHEDVGLGIVGPREGMNRGARRADRAHGRQLLVGVERHVLRRLPSVRVVHLRGTRPVAGADVRDDGGHVSRRDTAASNTYVADLEGSSWLKSRASH